MKHIGFVEILRDRFYDNTEHGSVLVPIGRYRLLEDVDGSLGLDLEGYPAKGACEPERIGQGLFLIDPSDRVASSKPVKFVRWIVGDRDKFLRSELCREGDPEQRLRITIGVS